MKRLLLATALVAGLMVTSSANAAVPPITIDKVDYKGYSVSTSGGWRFLDCTADGYDASWQKIARSDSWAFWPGWVDGSDSTGYGEWNGWAIDGVVHATIDCTLERDTVRYEQRWRWFTKVRYGPNTSSRSRSSSCYIGRDYAGDLELDCWGGRFASATWRFSLPSDARQISRAIIGYQRCCPNGTLTRRWSGNTATVRVTNWRSYYVDRVRIRYQHRARTPIPVTETGNATATY